MLYTVLRLSPRAIMAPHPGAIMKKILLSLLLITSCATKRFYQGPAVTQELRKNATSLELVITSIESDFKEKQTFLKRFEVKGKDPFITENLETKLAEMNMKREAVLAKSFNIREENNSLLHKVENKSKIKEGDSEFRAIENFAVKKDQELSGLIKEFGEYRKASAEFEKLAFFTRMVKR